MAKGPGAGGAGSNGPAPVLIKRKRVVGGDGHHGGAWKVAMAWVPCRVAALLRQGFGMPVPGAGDLSRRVSGGGMASPF